MHRPLALLLLLSLPLAAHAAEAPPLVLPIDCVLGQSCWVLNYPDTDPGPAARDYRCRDRSYDTHDGIDIAVRDQAAMARGVAVLAPAAGTVKAVHDGEPDTLFLKDGRDAVAGKECGNGLVIDHGGSWESQLCHLAPGSLTVRPGQTVAPGQAVGKVGLSGMSEFPHVHLALRQGQTRIDPFTGADLRSGCGRPVNGLWRTKLAYEAGQVYAIGFASQMPNASGLKADAASPPTLPADAPALVLWAAMLGAEAADRLRLTIGAPDGSVIADHLGKPPGKSMAWRMEAAGRKAPAGGWPPGTYVGTVVLERAGMPIGQSTVPVIIR